jgi:hypothetical protein
MGGEIQEKLLDGLTWPEVAAYFGANEDALRRKWTSYSNHRKKGGKR